jgi:hypothetical protein
LAQGSLTMEQLKQQLRTALKDAKRPDLYLAVIAAVAAWFITLVLRTLAGTIG